MSQVVVVGAGLAGLTCGRILHARGWDVTVLEAGDGVGGRVRTDLVEGFRLDRGFQVLFTAYPAVQRHLDLRPLHLRRFDPGAILARGRSRVVLSDPLRDPRAALPSLLTAAVTPGDKLRTVLLAARLRATSIPQLISGPDESTLAFLTRSGFSPRYIDGFVRPFYGGIFLDRSLATSAKCFKFNFKMLASGDTVVPAAGMGAISYQLAAPLVAAGRIRLGTRVESILSGNGRPAVRFEDGTRLEADTVVVATAAPEAARLTGHAMPDAWRSTVTLYWKGPQPLYRGNKVLLNSRPHPVVNNAAQVTNVSPECARPGGHLLSATMLGMPEGDDAALFEMARADLHRMFEGNPHAQARLAAYTPLALYRIPHAQFAQPPGIHPTLPDNVSGLPGVLFAGEFTEASSINAAMISGEKAAAHILAEAPPSP
ncbi:MAG TPA: NAD(P)/FAD-dependent oxidoreductase [Chloroflexia bacterium]|nr:NAD(P)/FAD-dependent oxidoreductase [Chloroflexia bacterium]